MKTRSIAAVVAIVLGAGLGRPAAQARQPGQAEVNEAQRRFQRATELYEENNLPGALAEFRKAYSLAPHYRVLYNIGQLCVLMQDNPCAYGAFSQYLAQGVGEIPERRRQEVQRDLARLQARVARLRIVADRPGAFVTVDDVSVGTTPLTEPVLVAAGRPRVRVTLEGYLPATQVVEVAAMETARVEIHLVPASPPSVREESPVTARPPPDPVSSGAPRLPGTSAPAGPTDLTRSTPAASSSSGTMTAVGITLGVVGLAGLAAGGFASYQIRSLEQEIENAGLGQLAAGKLTSQEKKAKNYEKWQWIGYGAGSATVVAAVVILMMNGGDDSNAEQARAPRLYGSVGPGGSTVFGFTGRF